MKLLHAILKFFAQAILKKYQPDVIGITGSMGKTSAKEAIYTALASAMRTRKNYKNYNNEIGLPLTIIGVDESPGKSLIGWLAVFVRVVRVLVVPGYLYPKVLVLEMGADKPGDITYLTNLAPCKIGVLTAIAHAHTEFFGSLQAIAREKRVIISHLAPSGTAVLNFDSPIVMEQASSTKATVVTYGFREGADFRASDVGFTLDDKTGWPTGLRFKVSHAGSVVPIFLSGIVAEPFIYSALAALAVAHSYGINIVTAGEQLNTTAPIPGHLCMVPGIKETLLIDDTYNSSPDPAKAALKLLGSIAVRGGAQRYAVLGDMLELGNDAQTLHREIGFTVAEQGIDCLITVGAASKHTAAGAREAGMPEHCVHSFDASPEAGRFLQEKIKSGDVLLIKGSQGMRMEKIVKELMADPLLAPELLVRQSPEWLRQ